MNGLLLVWLGCVLALLMMQRAAAVAAERLLPVRISQGRTAA